MAEIEDPLVVIANRSLECLAGLDCGRLKPVLSDHTELVDAALLDMFHQPLISSGRMLIGTEGRLLLLDRNGVQKEQKGPVEGGPVRDLPKGDVRKALKDLSDLRALMPLCRFRFRSVRMALVDDDGKIHLKVRFLEVQMVGGEIGLIAFLRPVRGYDRALEMMRESLHALGGSHDLVGFLSGVCLSFPVGVIKPAIVIGDEESAFAVATDIMAAYLPAARVNEKGIVNDLDTEFLHDYRIALRKIRSVLSLFKGVYADEVTVDLKRRFSRLMAKTGKLRDLDVYLLEKQKFFDLIPAPLHDGLEQMFALFLRDREEAAVRLADHLISDSYQKEMQELSDLLAAPERLQKGPSAEQGAHDYACHLIWKRYRKICKTAVSIDETSKDDDVHALRIHCKKLRYLMEFFAPLFPEEAIRSLIKPMKRLQDNLGRFNDCSVQIDALSGFLSGRKFRDKPTQMKIAQSVGALIAILHQRQAAERMLVAENFARFDSEETQQTFKTLFQLREESE